VARQLINTPRVIATVFWDPSGLYVGRFLESGTSFNDTYFTEYVFSDVEHLSALQTALQQKKKVFFHLENSFIHLFIHS
jgi:hypothetical protein